jgi:hypothetical protein
MNDQSILAELQSTRTTNSPTLEDGVFEDIWEGVKGAGTDVWDGIVGNGTEAIKESVNKKIDNYFETGNPATYDEQYQGPPVPTQQPEQKESFIKKIPPVVVGATGTVVAKFGFKLGWITSLAIGAGTGAAKHYLVDKKQGA